MIAYPHNFYARFVDDLSKKLTELVQIGIRKIVKQKSPSKFEQLRNEFC